jgi:general secretion pathway protein I
MAPSKVNPIMRNNFPTQQGLTLIEVLIALMIVSIAFTAIIVSTSQNIRNTQYLQNKMIANWVSLQIINQIRDEVLTVPESEPLTGESETLGQKWFWKASLTPTPNPKIQKIEVSVAQSEDGKRIINLTSYIHHEQPK